MEVKSNLRRAQSLRSVSSDHSLSWTEAGLRERKKSVSQLVADYQNSLSGKATKADSVENKQKLITTIPVTEVKLDTLVQNNESRERAKVRSTFGGHSNLTRSKSMEILPRQKNISTSALKELFESKVAQQSKSSQQLKSVQQAKSSQQPKNTQQPKKVDQLHNDLLSEDAGINHRAAEEPKVQTKSMGTKKSPPKEEDPISKVVRTQRPERRKTITGVYTERTSSREDDKRKSVADFRDSFTLYGQDKSPISVKAISALYLSKVAAADPTGSLLKPVQGPTSPTKPKVIKFQPTAQDMCSACLKPVYPMEKMSADKFIFHKSCFCCRHCKQKLSLRNYAPLYGEFYCVFHYQQLFKKKGNYDEGFGYQQHKSRWLLSKTNGTDGI